MIATTVLMIAATMLSAAYGLFMAVALHSFF